MKSFELGRIASTSGHGRAGRRRWHRLDRAKLMLELDAVDLTGKLQADASGKLRSELAVR